MDEELEPVDSLVGDEDAPIGAVPDADLDDDEDDEDDVADDADEI